MGGEIGVRSEPGQGSTFWFTARLKRPAGAQPPRSVPPEVLVGLRVLVVDDNAANRTILEHQITSWQMQAGLAQDGPSALDMLRAAAASGEPYDVALLDMNMPGMDGCELARAIGADLALGATRLVLLTSVGVRGSADAARRAGMSAYLTKPVRQSQLYDTLAMVMGGEPSERVLETLVTRHTISEARVRAGARVLVAEDNPTNQKVASAMLRKIGYRADVVANGAEAADALARVGPAAVLMDCQMPEMDGYEATAKIREGEAESSRHTPIIAMTASAMESDRQRCFAAGMDDYVAKPVRLEELAAVLARWIPEGDATPGSQATRDPSTDESPDAVLDPKMLDPLQKLHIGEGEAGIYEFVDQLVEDASTNLGKLHDAIAEGDAAVVGRLSHTLRGTVGIAGAARMASMCAELEADASEGELTAASSMIHRIEREFARVRTALRERFPASRQRGPVAPSKR